MNTQGRPTILPTNEFVNGTKVLSFFYQIIIYSAKNYIQPNGASKKYI